MKAHTSVYFALPVLNEFKNLPGLLDSLKAQTFRNFTLVVCVNQYESWWDILDKLPECLDNQKSIEYLRAIEDIDIIVIDKSSKGLGWPDKKGGVGWARKVAMDYINQITDLNDIIVSIDADTYYPENYLESIVDTIKRYPKIMGLAIPYYHKINGGETDKLILRYEIYMRNYQLNMLKMKNPYAYTALGSAMVVPIWAYRKVGGITPVKSGEDFYFLQKLIKTGNIGIWTDTIAYPSSRFSGRVLFGTGPALIKGNTGDWSSYPVYSKELFENVKDTFVRFPDLFDRDCETPMDSFLKEQFKTKDLWALLRSNYKDRENFVKACAIKVDGLRILQFLKKEHQKMEYSILSQVSILDGQYIIDEMNIKELSKLRNLLFKTEQGFREQIQIIGNKTA